VRENTMAGACISASFPRPYGRLADTDVLKDRELAEGNFPLKGKFDFFVAFIPKYVYILCMMSRKPPT